MQGSLGTLAASIAPSASKTSDRRRMRYVDESMTEEEKRLHLRYKAPANVDLSAGALETAGREMDERNRLAEALATQSAIDQVRSWTDDPERYERGKSAQDEWAASFKAAYGWNPLDDGDAPDVQPAFRDVPQEVRDRASALCAQIENSGRGWWIIGGYGSGKTTLATWTLKLFRQDGWGGEFVDQSHYLKALQGEMDGLSPRGSTLERYGRTPLLVFDDMGATSPSKWSAGEIQALIDERFRGSLPVIVTTNYGPDQLEARLGDADSGGRIKSRLLGMCEIVRMPDIDHRRQRA